MPDEPALAPSFTLEDMDGRRRSVEEFRGRVVFLRFWATWCGPCKEELPAVKALWEEYSDRGLTVVGVAEDSRARVEPFVKDYGMRFPVLLDPYGKVMREYGVRVIPVTVIIDRDGFVLGRIVGGRDYKSPEAREYIEGLLD